MKKVSRKPQLIVGIDEVGRGPIAGPVCVGACLILDNKRAKALFKPVKESKQLSELLREQWFGIIKKAQYDGVLVYAVTQVGVGHIDRYGIVSAINKALTKSLIQVTKNFKPHEVSVELDGGLKAPPEFSYQETYIKGDENFMSIALASIVAKVTRDRYMIRMSQKYPQYDLHIHKGYGTKKHYEKIKLHGVSELHRKTFLKNLEQ